MQRANSIGVAAATAAVLQQRQTSQLDGALTGPGTLVALAAQRLNSRASHLHGLASRIQAAMDRVIGSEPIPDQPNAPSHTQCDRQQLDDAISLLDLAISRLERQTDRVEQI